MEEKRYPKIEEEDGSLTAALVNYILGRGTRANEAAAYENDDTMIDIQDVTALIELIK